VVFPAPTRDAANYAAAMNLALKALTFSQVRSL